MCQYTDKQVGSIIGLTPGVSITTPPSCVTRKNKFEFYSYLRIREYSRLITGVVLYYTFLEFRFFGPIEAMVNLTCLDIRKCGFDSR